MTTTHITTAEPLGSTTSIEKSGVVQSSGVRRQSVEPEEEEFLYLYTYEVEPPETQPNEEWLLQRHPVDSIALESTESIIASTMDFPFLQIDEYEVFPSNVSQRSKLRSRARVKKSHSTSLISAKKIRSLPIGPLVQVKDRIQLINELVDNFNKSSKSFSFGLSLFLKRIAPRLYNESDSLRAIPQEMIGVRKNIPCHAVLQSLMKYRAVKKLYLEHVNRIKAVFKPDLFLDNLIYRYNTAGLEDTSGENGLLKRLVHNVERAGSTLQHLDKEIDAFAIAYFPNSSELRNDKTKASLRNSTIRELGLKAPSPMKVVQTVRDTSQKSLFLEKVKVVSGLMEHRILNDMVTQNLRTLLEAMNTMSHFYDKASEEEVGLRLVKSAQAKRSGTSYFEGQIDNQRSTENTRDNVINEFNVSKFCSLSVKKFKDFVVKQVSQELAKDLKSIFTVPFMIPYAETLTSGTKLSEMVLNKVRDMIKLLQLPKLFATFRASSEPDAEMRYATRVTEEKLIRATVPILLTTGNNLIKRYAITGANRPTQGMRSPIRKTSAQSTIQKNLTSNCKNQKSSKIEQILVDADFDDITDEKTAMNYIAKNIIEEDLKLDELPYNTLLTPRTTSKVLADCLIDKGANEISSK